MPDSKAPPNTPASWAGSGGHAWVATQDLIDQLFRPLERILVDAVMSSHARRVLDVGCGTGGTTVALAHRLAGAGTCTGVDLSEPMIASARRRGEEAGVTVDFIVADAQHHPFPAATFDAVVSRFGVMFFDDPVAAFANLRKASAPGATLRQLVWRSADENPFMTAAEQAAASLLPELPVRRPNEPGQFGLADQGHVHRILAASGWSEGELQPLDVPCVLPAHELERYLSHLGPVGRALQEAGDEQLLRRVMAAVLPAFDRYVVGDQVRFVAACWMLCARA